MQGKRIGKVVGIAMENDKMMQEYESLTRYSIGDKNINIVIENKLQKRAVTAVSTLAYYVWSSRSLIFVLMR